MSEEIILTLRTMDLAVHSARDAQRYASYPSYLSLTNVELITTRLPRHVSEGFEKVKQA
jgi:hypothetical protein